MVRLGRIYGLACLLSLTILPTILMAGNLLPMKPFSSTAKFKVVAPRAIVPLQELPYIVSITSGSKSAPVHDALVTMALSMPGMAMPPNVVTLQEEYPGCYKGSVIFTMAGKWQVTTTATLPTKERAKLFSTVVVK